jgi:4-diphosphocytidyl-2-C-methyl-D-erythritol kinase
MSVSSLAEFAPAKINLALHVLGRRTDGYHELDSIVAFADVGDQLTLTRADATSLTLSGPFASGLRAEPDNLVLRAFAALGGEARLGPVAFHLEKNLPIASGIGGGSADAAAALRGLARLFSLPMGEVENVALSLGADVPVCLHGKTVRMRGIGERLEPVELRLSPAIVLVNPGTVTATPEVFKALGLANGQSFGTALDPNDQTAWRNDLAAPAISLAPEISEVIRILSSQSRASSIRMSGSGATCFALMPDSGAATAAVHAIGSAKPAWWMRSAMLTSSR